MRPLARFAAIAILVCSLAPLTPAAAGGGCHTEEISDMGGREVDVGKNCFFPTVLRVDPGSTVTWRSYDPVEHNVTAAGGLISETLTAGAVFDFRFAKTGVYPYYCSLHPGMAGAIVVGDATAETPVTVSKPVAATRSEEGVPGGAVAAIGLVAAGSGFGLGLMRRRAENA